MENIEFDKNRMPSFVRGGVQKQRLDMKNFHRSSSSSKGEEIRRKFPALFLVYINMGNLEKYIITSVEGFALT